MKRLLIFIIKSFPVLSAKEYKKGDKVKCTYIEIPPAKKTYDVLLAKPFWIWGCEMGVNEQGLSLNPNLPKNWRSLKFNLKWRGEIKRIYIKNKCKSGEFLEKAHYNNFSFFILIN